MSKLTTRMGYGANQLFANRPLEDDEIRSVCPSIFAVGKHESRSEKYQYIPSSEIVKAMRKEGFFPFFTAQGKSRIEGKAEFTKHLIRFRRIENITVHGSEELIYVNSHDGTSLYQFMGGSFQFVCMNGLVFGDTTTDIRIRHKGTNIIEQAIEGAYASLKTLEIIAEQRKAMQAITLSKEAQMQFASNVLNFRYNGMNQPIKPEQLLTIRRPEDDQNDVWTTFNKIEEHIIRGGLQGVTANNRRTRTRQITNISRTIELERGMWNIATEMMKEAA